MPLPFRSAHVRGVGPVSRPAETRVFVLRVWFEGGERTSFRAALHEGGVTRQYFASPDDCLEHLYRQFILPAAEQDRPAPG